MANLDPNGKPQQGGVSAENSRFAINLMLGVLFAFASIIYYNINEKITFLNSQIADVRSDSRIVQKDTYDLRLSIQELKARLTVLVETLNTREEQRGNGKR